MIEKVPLMEAVDLVFKNQSNSKKVEEMENVKLVDESFQKEIQKMLDTKREQFVAACKTLDSWGGIRRKDIPMLMKGKSEQLGVVRILVAMLLEQAQHKKAPKGHAAQSPWLDEKDIATAVQSIHSGVHIQTTLTTLHALKTQHVVDFPVGAPLGSWAISDEFYEWADEIVLECNGQRDTWDVRTRDFYMGMAYTPNVRRSLKDMCLRELVLANKGYLDAALRGEDDARLIKSVSVLEVMRRINAAMSVDANYTEEAVNTALQGINGTVVIRTSDWVDGGGWTLCVPFLRWLGEWVPVAKSMSPSAEIATAEVPDPATANSFQMASEAGYRGTKEEWDVSSGVAAEVKPVVKVVVTGPPHKGVVNLTVAIGLMLRGANHNASISVEGGAPFEQDPTMSDMTLAVAQRNIRHMRDIAPRYEVSAEITPSGLR